MKMRSDRFRGVARGLLLAILFGFAWVSAARGGDDKQTLGEAEQKAILAKIGPSVVQIVVETKKRSRQGCGYLVDPSGIVLTNAHIINLTRWRSCKRCYIRFPADHNKKEYATEGFLDVLPTRDLALLRFKPGERKCTALALAENLPKQGDAVFLSNILWSKDTPLTSGTVTAIRTGRGIEEILGDLQV